MQVTRRLGEVRYQPVLVAIAWAMLPSHVINVAVNVSHLLDDRGSVRWLTKVIFPLFALLAFSGLVAAPFLANTTPAPSRTLPHDLLVPELKTFACMLLEAAILGTVAKYGRLMFHACTEPTAWVAWMLLGVGIFPGLIPTLL